MNKINTHEEIIDLLSVGALIDDQSSMMLLDLFADEVDNEIQADLVSELMARHADVSKLLEAQNQQLILNEAALQRHNTHLEDLVEEKLAEIHASQLATIHALVKAVESRDDDTGAHIERTSAYCKVIAEKLLERGMYPDVVDGSYAEDLAAASPLHDIGKVGIADAILLKPGKHTPDEFEIMKTHVSIGHHTLASVVEGYPENTFLKLGCDIARCHHEKWDGSGYLTGMKGEDIPLSARIMALSDVYDALRSRRVYKEPFAHDVALQIIEEGRGSHFDPALTDLFLEHHELFEEIYDCLSAEK